MKRKWFFRCSAWSNLNLLKKLNRIWKKLKIRRRKTYTNFCWFLLSLILYLFVARNRHNMQCNAYTHQLSWPHILTRGEHRFQYFGCKMVCELEWILFFCFYQQKELMQRTFNSSQQFLPAVWKHQSSCADFLSSNTKVTQFGFPATLCFKWACFFGKNVKEWEAIWYSPQTRSASATCYTACTQYGQNLGKFRGRRSIWGRNMNHMYGMVNSRFQRV